MDDIELYKIPLRNKHKEIINYSLVSADDYDIVSQYKWNLNNNGYAQGMINNKNIMLHSFIYGKSKNNKYVIDHINRNKLDNRRENLRHVNRSFNNHNRKKKDNMTSKYKGVSKNKNKYHVFAFGIYIGQFDSEIDAGIQYDRYTYITLGPDAVNNKLISYKDCININLKDILPKQRLNKNITKTKNNLYLVILKYKNNKFKKILNTLEEAEIQLQEFKNQINEIKKMEFEDYCNKPITRDSNNNAIIIIINKKNEIFNIIVDDNLWHYLSFNFIHIANNYANIYINKKIYRLHHYVMNFNFDYNKNIIIDHINRNTLDNRKSNLRLTNYTNNIHNGSKSKNSTSKYFGITKIINRSSYLVQINKENIHYNLGYFTDEKLAALIYNRKAIELYGEFARLNQFDDDFIKQYENMTIDEIIIDYKNNRIKKKNKPKLNYFGLELQPSGKYSVRFIQNKIRYYLGTYKDIEIAALIYNIKMKELCGDNYKYFNNVNDEIIERFNGMSIDEIRKSLK